MIQKIETIDDVKLFFHELLEEGLNFHADNSFSDYTNENDRPTYTEDEAALRNELLGRCFEVCEREDVDIHEISIEVFMKDFYEANPPE